MRCFIAVELDDAVQSALGRVQDRFRRDLGQNANSLKWVRPENIHLTLKFLGDVDDPLIPQVCTAVSGVAEQYEPFDFEIANPGCFGSADSARVLWVGIGAGHERLIPLAEAVDAAMNELGFAAEARRFSAHLTLARIRNVNLGRQVHQLVARSKPLRVGIQGVGQLTVFQSELSRAGPCYTAMHHAPLGAKL